MKKLLIILIAILSVIAIGLIGIAVLNGPVDSNDSKIIQFEVNNGNSTATIAANLESKDLIKSSLAFRIKSKLSKNDGKYRVGSYALSKDMGSKKIIDILVSGKTSGNIFSIPEGNTVEKNAKLLTSLKLFSEEEFLNVAKNGDFDLEYIKNLPKTTNRLEGFLYPDKYEAKLDAKPEDVINTMLNQFDKVFTEEYKQRAKELDLSVNQVITVASIVEKEAKTKQDKKDVASVIYNRLDKNMMLQMDSILAYIHKEDKIKASLEDTKIESSYNPYKNQGLPPGPICSPGKASIEAALYPSDTNYIYFVAGEKLDGTNVFSENYEDFLKDKKKFDKAYKEYIKENPDKV